MTMFRANWFRFVLLTPVLLWLAACGRESVERAATEPQLVVYSARKEHLIKPLFDRYQALTGVRIQYVTDKAAPLLARLQSEGARTPADILMTVDAGNLWHAAQQGVLAPVESEVLLSNVPEHLRDPGRQWFGLTIRARTVVYHAARVNPDALDSYEGLADGRWRGRLCLRTSKKVYNQSLVATSIASLGPARTEAMVRAWVDNLAVPPFANDTAAMQALIAGQCDVTLVNSYYFGRLQSQYLARGEPFPLAIHWPAQSGRGVHVNISGAGITRHAGEPALALALLEWLTQPEAQALLVALNQEYPVNAEATLTEQMLSWGEFRADTVPIDTAGRLQADAIRLMDRAGYR